MDLINDIDFTIELVFDWLISMFLLKVIYHVVYDIINTMDRTVKIIILMFSLLTYGIYFKFLYFLPGVISTLVNFVVMFVFGFILYIFFGNKN